MVIRNWRQVTPYVGHESAIIWPVLLGKGAKDRTEEEAPLIGASGFTVHMMQGGAGRGLPRARECRADLLYHPGAG